MGCSCSNKSCTDNCSCTSVVVKCPKGQTGDQGLSAYQEWLLLGNSGTNQDFIDSLEGAKGDKGDKGDAYTPGGGLTWNDLTLINNWEVGTTGSGTKTPQYTVDDFGFIRFRGNLNGENRTGTTFAMLPPSVLTNNVRQYNSLISGSDVIGVDNIYLTARFILETNGNLQVLPIDVDNTNWYLESLPPYYIIG